MTLRSRALRTAGLLQSAGLLRAASLLAAALLVAGCASGPTPTPGPIETAAIVAPASGLPAASATALVSPVTGVLTHVESTGLSEVSSFTLRLDDGREIPFRIGVLENGAVFPPGHLAEHLATSSRVRVYFRAEGTDLVAYRLEDAG